MRYELHYWPTIRGRGEFVRLALEAAGAGVREIAIPALLIWSDSDVISPVAVGAKLGALLPRAELHVLRGGGHDLATRQATEVASLIACHIESEVPKTSIVSPE
jgi:pimeloyl-ACP methyl ester carboxylesterase